PQPLRTMARSLLRAMRVLPKPEAPDYLRRHVTRSWEKESRLLASFGLRDGMSILEMGCGPGHFAGKLAEWLPNSRITGIDSNSTMLEAARRGYGESIALLPANAAAVGLAENSFDFVIARLLFQHLADPMPVAREAFRLLKPGGIFVIVDIDDDLFGAV